MRTAKHVSSEQTQLTPQRLHFIAHTSLMQIYNEFTLKTSVASHKDNATYLYYTSFYFHSLYPCMPCHPPLHNTIMMHTEGKNAFPYTYIQEQTAPRSAASRCFYTIVALSQITPYMAKGSTYLCTVFITYHWKNNQAVKNLHCTKHN